MNSVKEYDNWKDYFETKFGDKTLFQFKQIDEDNQYLYSIVYESTNEEIETSIVVRIFYADNFTEIHDIYFTNPNSPKWTLENEQNSHGWDGQGSTFNYENLVEVEEWLDIPLNLGWTETTYFFDGIEKKTEISWTNGGNHSIIIKQNYLENYGCLMFPIVPFVIMSNSIIWKIYPNRITKEDRVVKPVFPTVK
jgi:hypothetical protein